MGRKKKEWLTSIDGRERPEHNAANGQVVSQQDSFTVGGERLMYPGDPSGSPWNTINCRCTTIPVLEEMAGVGEEGIPPSLTHIEQGKLWIASLSQEEKGALAKWGQSGRPIRKLQSGHPEQIESRYQRRRAEYDLPYWESALSRGVQYRGRIYRGLSDVPFDIMQTWQQEGFVTLANDQSATKDSEYVKGYYAGGWGHSRTEVNILWDVNQQTGIDLFGQTNVTYGGKLVEEREIVMRKGTRYRIKNVQFVDQEGKPWPPSDYFEGTEWSIENPPPNWFPHHDKRGSYVLRLEEWLTN